MSWPGAATSCPKDSRRLAGPHTTKTTVSGTHVSEGIYDLQTRLERLAFGARPEGHNPPPFGGVHNYAYRTWRRGPRNGRVHRSGSCERIQLQEERIALAGRHLVLLLKEWEEKQNPPYLTSKPLDTGV